MRLKVIGPNQTEIDTDKATVLFSYSTPVAACIVGRGWVRTATTYSRTTSKHINAWLPKSAKVETIPQAELDKLID